MSPMSTAGQVYDAIQQVKAGASAFCTNFFPAQKKLQGWIDHGELLGKVQGEAATFLRRHRDFWHFYFCAGNVAALQSQMGTLDSLKKEQLGTDLVGNEA